MTSRDTALLLTTVLLVKFLEGISFLELAIGIVVFALLARAVRAMWPRATLSFEEFERIEGVRAMAAETLPRG